ncbi:MAG: hypothetical protein ACYC2H_08945, partial [Thermoplasmatota archaeon]
MEIDAHDDADGGRRFCRVRGIERALTLLNPRSPEARRRGSMGLRWPLVLAALQRRAQLLRLDLQQLR